MVHNGTLENVEELREELKHLGVNLVSKTDTEVSILSIRIGGLEWIR